MKLRVEVASQVQPSPAHGMSWRHELTSVIVPDWRRFVENHN